MRGQRKSVGLPIQLNNAVNMVWYIKKLAFASGDLQPTIYSQNHWCGCDVHVEWKFLAKHFCYCALNCVFKTRFQDLNTTTNNYHTQLDINSVRELSAVIREIKEISIARIFPHHNRKNYIFSWTNDKYALPMHF